MIQKFEKGNTIRILATVTDEDGNVVEPDEIDSVDQIFIEIKDSDKQTVMLDTMMDSLSNTQFYKNWSTTKGMTNGEYEIEIRSSVSGQTVLNRDKIQLTDII